MTKFLYVVRELGRNLRRNPGTVLGSLLSLTLLFLLFDLYWVAAGTSKQYYDRLLSRLRLEVFVSEDIADSSLATLETVLAASEAVGSIEFVSRQDARDELS
ncbi:MAG: hypothetical protein AB1744_12400, partial [Candidatus Zixiibacteriota bacterium]